MFPEISTNEGSTSNSLTISQVIESIQSLIEFFSNVKTSIPLSPPTESKDSASISTSKIVNYSNIENYQQLHNQMSKWEVDLIYIRSAIGNLQDLVLNVRTLFNTLREQGQILNRDLNSLLKDPKGTRTLKAKEIQANVMAVTEIIMKLKYHIPYPQKMNLGSDNDGVKIVRNVKQLFDVLLKLDAYQKFRGCSALEDFEEKFASLPPGARQSLLSFSVFPAGAVLGKRLLMNWWTGESLLEAEEIFWFLSRHYEEEGEDILNTFEEMGFIEPVLKNWKLSGFKMNELIRYAVIFKAEKLEFFSFDSSWNPTGDFLTCRRAALVQNEDGNSRDMVMSLNPENLITLLNISDCNPNLDLSCFMKMRNVRVLCLGRWEQSATSHIEVEDTKFLKGLKNMKQLKFISLQGVTGINKLPNEVMKCTNLMILDLKACSNLEALPDTMGSLRNLIHLDVSECNLLDRMPQGIELLSKLRVIKGFVVPEKKIKGSGSISGLSKLSFLRKLSIRTTKRDFPEDEELSALCICLSLRKLTITWTIDNSNSGRLRRTRAFRLESVEGATTLNSIENTDIVLDGIGCHRFNLEKLDLQYFPKANAPWLTASILKSLDKLYIKGGNLQHLIEVDQDGGDRWNVKILCLESLPCLKMDWREVKDAFPALIYVDKVDCPVLTSFPCDNDGVWRNMKDISSYMPWSFGLSWDFRRGDRSASHQNC